PLFPYTTLFRSQRADIVGRVVIGNELQRVGDALNQMLTLDSGHVCCSIRRARTPLQGVDLVILLTRILEEESSWNKTGRAARRRSGRTPRCPRPRSPCTGRRRATSRCRRTSPLKP